MTAAFAAVLTVVVAVIAIRYIPREAELGDETEQKERIPFGQRLRTSLSVWADWRLILIGVVMLGMAFGEGSANDWVALAVVDGHGQSNSTGAIVFGTRGIAPSGSYGGYEPLVVEIVKFFKTGKPPVSAEETIEMFAFMEAADESKRQGGKPVSIQSVIEKARAQLAASAR